MQFLGEGVLWHAAAVGDININILKYVNYINTYNHIFLGAGLLWHATATVGEKVREDLPDAALPPEGETSRHQQENICQN